MRLVAMFGNPKSDAYGVPLLAATKHTILYWYGRELEGATDARPLFPTNCRFTMVDEAR